MSKGKLIAVEGPDQTSLMYCSKILMDELLSNNIPVILSQEPSGGPIGLLVRVSEEKRINLHPLPLATLRLADRLDQQYMKKDGINSSVSNGVSVIKVNYLLAALSAFDVDTPISWLKSINKICTQPDYVLYIDMQGDIEVSGEAKELAKKYSAALDICTDIIPRIIIIQNQSQLNVAKETLVAFLTEEIINNRDAKK